MTKIKNISKAIIIASLAIIICISFTACAPKKYGEFYSLQEAYDKGLLTREDLLNIAYLNNGYTEEGFTPSRLNPEKLSEDTENKIKETIAYELRRSNSHKNATEKDVFIKKYFGTYNGSVAVLYTTKFSWYYDAEYQKYIAGVHFVFPNSNHIQIWIEK